MKYTIVTTFNQDGLNLYGQTMIDTFEKYWPDDVTLKVYAEDCCPKTTKDNVEIIDLNETVPELVAFKAKHKDNPMANGLLTNAGTAPPKGPHNFKWDAVRFSHKVYAITHAGLNCDSDWIIWLDADTKTFAPLTLDVLEELCPVDYCASYLGRPGNYHSECGWVAYNCNHPFHKKFMQKFRNIYESGEFLKLKESHDSFVFDHVRLIAEAKGVQFFNLNPTPDVKFPGGHVFINSTLGRYMDHMKGNRKLHGTSGPKNQVLNDDVEYWNSTKGH